jgi:hypothetical protein
VAAGVQEARALVERVETMAVVAGAVRRRRTLRILVERDFWVEMVVLALRAVGPSTAVVVVA